MDNVPGIRKWRKRYRVHVSLSEDEARQLADHIKKNPEQSTSETCRKLIISGLEQAS